MVALVRFFSRLSWDVVGFSASAVCAIHCLVVPALLLFSSYSGMSFLHDHTVETIILLFSSIIGSLAIIPSWFRHHRKALPLLLFFAGIIGIASGRLNESIPIEMVLTCGGATLVATAHWINWKLCRLFHNKVELEKN
jgi:hypothetical protein